MLFITDPTRNVSLLKFALATMSWLYLVFLDLTAPLN